MLNKWEKYSWKNFQQLHQPKYENTQEFENSLNFLNSAENIVSEKEIFKLQFFLTEASKGRIFLLHAGDCAEAFENCNVEDVFLRVSNLRKLAQILQSKIKIPVVIIGRIAGQYAKPRSHDYDIINNIKLPKYKGDIINGIQFNENSRKPCPNRLVIAYKNSLETMNWIHDYFSKLNILYLNSRFFISHEALLLNYESCLTRKSEFSKCWYNYGAHYVWVGERTRFLNSAHVEYLRGISNPIGIKLSTQIDPKELIELLNILNPTNSQGKINLITRMGEENIQKYLPNLIKIVKEQRKEVCWSCDPMHGNTITLFNGTKTRKFKSILNELINTFKIHNEYQSHFSGIHLELTYHNVTECIGGNDNISEESIYKNYKTLCDPRLNYNQSIELLNAFANNINIF